MITPRFAAILMPFCRLLFPHRPFFHPAFRPIFTRLLPRLLLFPLLLPLLLRAQSPDTTYAERLGWPKGARLLILHVDDAGMSIESNECAINVLSKGVATSVSVMMPCPWVPG